MFSPRGAAKELPLCARIEPLGFQATVVGLPTIFQVEQVSQTEKEQPLEIEFDGCSDTTSEGDSSEGDPLGELGLLPGTWRRR